MAGSNDFTGQNIQDTYQRVLQVSSSGQIADGTGSLFLPPSASFAISASYAVSASHEIIKEISSSHADIADGLTGQPSIHVTNITASGDISASGNIFSLYHRNIGNLEVGGKAQFGSTNFVLNPPSTVTIAGDLKTSTHITASGNISASGTIFSNILNSVSDTQVGGDLLFTQNGASQQHVRFSQNNDQIYWDGSDIVISIADEDQHNFKRSGLSITGNITASGNISASGIITAATMSIGGDYTEGQSPIQFRDDVRLFDNSELRIGTGPSGGESADLKLYHDGTDSYIENGSGEFIILQSSGDTTIKNFGIDDGVNIILDKNPVNPAVGSTGTVLISGSANPGIRLDVRGHITASGDISSSGKIIATQFDSKTSGTGYKLSGAKALYTHDTSTVVGRTGRLTLTGSSARFGRTGDDMHVTASGDISSSGTIHGDALNLSYNNGILFGGIGEISKGGASEPLTFNTNIKVNTDITASGNISSSGVITANRLVSATDIRAAEITASTLEVSKITITGSSYSEAAVEISGAIATSRIYNMADMTTAAAGSNTYIDFIDGTNTNNIELVAAGRVNVDVGYSWVNLNEDSNDVDVTIKGSGDSFLLKTDAGNDRVGIGISNPSSKLHVNGDFRSQTITASGHISASGTIYADKFFVQGQRAVAVNASDVITIAGDSDSPGVQFGKHDGTQRSYNFDGSITASSDISSSAVVTGTTGSFDYLQGDTSLSTGLVVDGFGSFNSITASGDITASGLDVSGNINVNEITASGNIRLVGNRTITTGPAVNNLAIDSSRVLNLRHGEGYDVQIGGVNDDDVLKIQGNSDVQFVRFTDTSHGVIFDSHITASSFVSSSVGMLSPKYTVGSVGTLYQANDTFRFGQTLKGITVANVTASGNIEATSYVSASEFRTTGHITASGNLEVANRSFPIPAATAGEGHGDILYYPSATGLTAGLVYYMDSSATWTLANADAVADSTNMLAVALGSAASDGMLIRGYVCLHTIDGSNNEGIPIYLDTTDGHGNVAAPTTSTHVVRIIGYGVSGADNRIWFDPDKSWVELA